MFSSCFLAVQWSFLSTTSRGLLAAEQQYLCCCCCCCITSVMSNSVQPHRWQPTRLPSPWDSPGKNTGVGCHFLLQCIKVKVKSLSRVWLFATPWTAAHQAPPSMGFSRQEYWSGVPLPSPLYCVPNIGSGVSNVLLWRVSVVCNISLRVLRWQFLLIFTFIMFLP